MKGKMKMKKNLSFILALVMIIGALFSVIPMAEGESDASTEATAKYVPEIAYANVNYVDSIYMMFAVPAAQLGEGEALKLIVWESRLDSIAFSYSDIIKEVIEPEATKATIGGAEYFVFKYNALDATQMTDVICARPVVVKDDKATAYGKVIEYSILEYVASAKGEIDGIAGLSNTDLIAALDQMLVFGSLAQRYSADEIEFYADDEVNCFYATSIVNGIEKGKEFAGFFKYEEGGVATFNAPFVDGTTIEKITDSEGKVLEDADEFTDGLQIEAKDADISLVVYYKNAIARSFNPDAFGIGMEANNYDAVVGGNGLVKKTSAYGVTFTGAGSVNFSGQASQMDSYNRMNYWHSLKTVADPSNPDNIVWQLTATNKPALNFSQVTPADFAGIGFGDTIYPAFTFEMTLGTTGGKMPSTGLYYFRHRVKPANGSVDTVGYADLNLFRITNGEVLLTDGTVVGAIPETGMRKFAITIDALTGAIYGYAENLETGVMEKTSEGMIRLADSKTFNGRHEAYLADPVANADLYMYENIYTFFTQSAKLEPTWVFGNGGNTNAEFENATIVLDGVETPIHTKDADGNKIFNMDAVKALAERDHSFLLDDFNLVMGFAYN